MSDEFSDEEIFERPLESIPLDDLIYELKARLNEGSDAWPVLLTTVQEHIVDAAPADGRAEWADIWIKQVLVKPEFVSAGINISGSA